VHLNVPSALLCEQLTAEALFAVQLSAISL